jgi:hypothetical protein
VVKRLRLNESPGKQRATLRLASNGVEPGDCVQLTCRVRKGGQDLMPRYSKVAAIALLVSLTLVPAASAHRAGGFAVRGGFGFHGPGLGWYGPCGWDGHPTNAYTPVPRTGDVKLATSRKMLPCMSMAVMRGRHELSKNSNSNLETTISSCGIRAAGNFVA